MLHTIRHISRQEPSIGVGQEVVNGVTFRDRTIALQRVDVVIRSADTEFRFEQAGSDKHRRRRNNQLARLSRDEQAALVHPRRNLNNGGFKRSLVKVSSGRRDVRVGTSSDGRVRSREQRDTVAARIGSVEAVVQDRRSLGLLGVRHSASEGLGVAGRERVIEVILNGFFGQREPKGNRFVVIAGGESFLRVIIGDSATFVLNRSSREARQLGFFFERTLRSFGFKDFLMLLAVARIFQTEQSIQTGQEFLKELCA